MNILFRNSNLFNLFFKKQKLFIIILKGKKSRNWILLDLKPSFAHVKKRQEIFMLMEKSWGW